MNYCGKLFNFCGKNTLDFHPKIQAYKNGLIIWILTPKISRSLICRNCWSTFPKFVTCALLYFYSACSFAMTQFPWRFFHQIIELLKRKIEWSLKAKVKLLQLVEELGRKSLFWLTTMTHHKASRKTLNRSFTTLEFSLWRRRKNLPWITNRDDLNEFKHIDPKVLILSKMSNAIS